MDPDEDAIQSGYEREHATVGQPEIRDDKKTEDKSQDFWEYIHQGGEKYSVNIMGRDIRDS